MRLVDIEASAESFVYGQVQVRICTAATLLAALPSMVHQMLRPSKDGLLLAMTNSAFAFFLFSFQVRAVPDS